jgi:hypothetical protein
MNVGRFFRGQAEKICQFGPMNGRCPRRLNAYTNVCTVDGQHDEGNLVAHHDSLTCLPGQNKHDYSFV